jgi:hypothetical protein
MMRKTINRFRRSLAMRGIRGTFAMCAVSMMDTFSPAAWRAETERQDADVAFDQQWNVDTAGIFRPDETGVHGDNWCYGIRYQAVDATELSGTLKNISISYEEFTFVDFGSGKGRALIVAAGFPFKTIIGVEYCDELNTVARENLSRLPAPAQRCPRIEIVHSDATHFTVPHGPLVLYFFNPFGRPVMEQVAQNVADSFRANRRRMVVLYFTPYEADLWALTGIFKRLQDSPAIFDTGTTSS